MDKDSTFIVHYNPGLKNQALYAEHLKSGFDMLEIGCVLTSNPSYRGDYHVCIGPHYAYRECIGKPTIYIDRCLWGDDLEYVTIGWLNNRGGMIYPKGSPGDRMKPKLDSWKKPEEIRDVLYCLDYGPYPLQHYHEAMKQYSTTLRPHPATKKKQPTLLQHLKGKDLVIGHRSSALVTAAIKGYPVVCLDDRSPVAPVAGRDILDVIYPDRTQWINDLSYAQWSGAEIASGEALEYVINNFVLSSAGADNA